MTDRRRLEQVRISSTEGGGKVLRSINPDVWVGERVMTQHDGFDDACADRPEASTAAIETARRLRNLGLNQVAGGQAM
ncbi:hypothetical protein FDV58_35145 [Bradyrhizobium elkanii]|uniref:Uncharacterized protein n=1 Tax=Bradyrhizobium elkanii TaxID=29448 RepID=A0A4U6RIK6_BRAEL|nr:hypothetical protein [Bradyrhizobium elkanii]TKV73891.1 hypothetical protein FDV58_35145 [Bradyrhizobium elkanii]